MALRNVGEVGNWGILTGNSICLDSDIWGEIFCESRASENSSGVRPVRVRHLVQLSNKFPPNVTLQADGIASKNTPAPHFPYITKRPSSVPFLACTPLPKGSGIILRPESRTWCTRANRPEVSMNGSGLNRMVCSPWAASKLPRGRIYTNDPTGWTCTGWGVWCRLVFVDKLTICCQLDCR